MELFEDRWLCCFPHFSLSERPSLFPHYHRHVLFPYFFPSQQKHRRFNIFIRSPKYAYIIIFNQAIVHYYATTSCWRRNRRDKSRWVLFLMLSITSKGRPRRGKIKMPPPSQQYFRTLTLTNVIIFAAISFIRSDTWYLWSCSLFSTIALFFLLRPENKNRSPISSHDLRHKANAKKFRPTITSKPRG